jgi:hypothetical protein
MTGKNDKIGQIYYTPLRSFEIAEDATFWLSSALSILVLVVEKSKYSILYDIIQILFIVNVVTLFVISNWIRLFWAHRAHDRRIMDFLSYSLKVPLITERSAGYFDNDECGKWRRIGACLLENTLFSKSIVARMLVWQRTYSGLYILLWSIALTFRETDLAWIGVLAQVILSEQLLSRWLRMEWLHRRTERVYDDVYKIMLRMGVNVSSENEAAILASLLRYETAKSQAAISLSSRTFAKLNARVSAEWREICNDLKIAPARQ